MKRILMAAVAVAFSCTLAATTAKAADDIGTVVQGALLYDKWYKVTKAPKPEDTHKAWPASNKKTGDATHRCKSCHGWDYLGKDGAYAKGSYLTGIKGISAYKGGDPAKVIAIMRDDTHGFGDKMNDASLAALAAFVTQGQIDMAPYISADKKVNGDPAKGRDIYVTICANCHGETGKELKDTPPLGLLSNDNPWEIMHKIVNGQPAEKMPAMRAFDLQVSADILAYLQTLPKE